MALQEHVNMSELSDKFLNTMNFGTQSVVLKGMNFTVREMSADALIKIVGTGDIKAIDSKATNIVPKLIIESLFDEANAEKVFGKESNDMILASMSVSDLTTFIDAFNKVNKLDVSTKN